MRKVVLAMALSAVMMLNIIPAFGQDANDTIADILVRESEGEAPEFNTLLEAVGNADQEVLGTLLNRDARITLFAPTDMAFSALVETMGEDAFNALLEDKAALTDLLLFHIVDGVVTTEELTARLDEDPDNGFSLSTMNGQYMDVQYTEFTPEPEATAEAEEVTPTPQEAFTAITFNGARLRVEMSDIVAANGIIHVIDTVMQPESHSIAELVVARSEDEEEPELTQLLGTIGLSDQSVLQTLMDQNGEITLFAPTDAAFEAFIDEIGQERFDEILNDPDALNDFLRYHMIASTMTTRQLTQRLLDAATSGDEDGLEIEMMNGDVTRLTTDEDGALLINDTPVVTANIDAVNGVIHIIDSVLMPPSLETQDDEAEEES